MSKKEARRVYVMEQVVEGKMTVRQGAQCLGLSERQVKRLKKGMKEKGVAALAHGNRGRSPKHTISKHIRDEIASLAAGLYKGASAEHMSELLSENQGIRVSGKSITRILREKGILDPCAKKHRRRRKSRDRVPKEGLLVQVDASPYDWLEGRGPKMHLHGVIDDATSKVLGLHFRLEEDLKGYLEALRQVVTKHGVPRAVYSDGHTIFFSPKKDKLTIEQELAGEQVSLTQLGRALDQLGIIQVRAGSPQAKGRVERLWETLQSRLVVELRVAGISTMEDANAFLPRFIERFNKRFAVEAQDPEPAYMPIPAQEEVDTILCVKEPRIASNGSTISYRGQTYRLVDHKGRVLSLPPRAKVEVLLHLDNSIDALYMGQRYQLEAFSAPKPESRPSEPVQRKPVGHKPSPDNPWVKFRLPPRVPHDPVESYFRKHEVAHLSNLL